LNVIFAKLPEAESGQMASGLRQAAMYLSEIEAGRQDAIQAKRGRESRKTQPEFIVTAYADNPQSKHVLEASGFIDKGPVDLVYEPEQKNYHFDYYELDWDKLRTTMQQNANNSVDVLRGQPVSTQPAPKPRK
jgi:hypothetical protein